MNSTFKVSNRLSSLPHVVHRSSLSMPSSWDPVRIILQIILLQLLYYIGMLIFGMVFSVTPTLKWNQLTDWIFNVDYLDIEKYSTYTIGCILIYLPLWMSLCIVSIIGKARHCWDFATTVLFYHWLFSWHHERSLSIKFSFSYTWWIVHIFSTFFTTLISERWCLYYELQPIQISNEYYYTRLGFTDVNNPFKYFFETIYIKCSLISTKLAEKLLNVLKKPRLSSQFLAIKRIYRQFWRLWTYSTTNYTSTTIYDLEFNSDVEPHRSFISGESASLSYPNARIVTHVETLESPTQSSAQFSSNVHSNVYTERIESV